MQIMSKDAHRIAIINLDKWRFRTFLITLIVMVIVGFAIVIGRLPEVAQIVTPFVGLGIDTILRYRMDNHRKHVN